MDYDIPAEILGVFDIQGIKLSVWIERKEQSSIFANEPPRMVNIIYAVNEQYKLHFEANIDRGHLGYDIARSDLLSKRIKDENANGRLIMRVCDYNSICIANSVCNGYGIYISLLSINGVSIKNILYKNQVAKLKAKIAELESKVYEANVKIAELSKIDKIAT